MTTSPGDNSLPVNALAISSEEIHSGYVAIIGPPNAGKSTLLNTLLGRKVSIVSPKPQTTRQRILGVKDFKFKGEAAQVVFVDTPGFVSSKVRGELGRYLGTEVQEGAGDADICVLVLDSRELVNAKGVNVRALQELILEHLSRDIKAPGVVVLNKVDAVEKQFLLPLISECHRLFVTDAEKSLEFIPLSARTGEGVESLLNVLFGKLPKGPRFFAEGSLTDQTPDQIAAEVIREKLFYNLEAELPYSTAVNIEAWSEEGGILNIKAVILVERTSQKGIVIGKGGLMLKKIGTEARLDLEKILGRRIFLELYVRVEENWTRTARGLERAGYKL